MTAAEQPDSTFRRDELNYLFRDLAGFFHIALAVSGGSDSTALMVLANMWAKEVPHAPRVSVLTVDHGLRKGSRQEAETVGQWALELGFEHTILSWGGEKPRSRLQEKAREARYELLADWCRAHGVEALVTAHTIDDQAETMIMRLARGTGIEGLAGMTPVRQFGSVSLHRPFLGLTRERLRAFLKVQGHAWLDDPSNEDLQFERIRVRTLRSTLENAGFTAEALQETAQRARRADEALRVWRDNFIGEHVRRFEAGFCEIPAGDYRSLPEEMQIRVLDQLIQIFGAGGRAALSDLERLAGLMDSPEPRQRRSTLGGCQIALRQRSIVIGREPGRIDPRPVPLNGEIVWDGRWQITVRPPQPRLNVRPLGSLAGIARIKELPAFVQAGLPAICDGETPIFLPFCGQGPKTQRITVRFCR